MPLLKSSLALLHVLICFTTGHIVPGLQSSPISFRNITIPSGAPPHTPDLSAWQRIAHNGYVHFKIVMGLDPPHSQLHSAQSKRNHYSSIYQLLKDGGMSLSWKQNLEQEDFPLQRVMKNLWEAASTLQQPPALAVCPLPWQHPGANMRLHRALVQPASPPHTSLGILHGFGRKQHY